MTIKRCANCGKARRIYAHDMCRPCDERTVSAPVCERPHGLRAIAAELGVSAPTVLHAWHRGRLVQEDGRWVYTPGRDGRPRQ